MSSIRNSPVKIIVRSQMLYSCRVIRRYTGGHFLIFCLKQVNSLCNTFWGTVFQFRTIKILNKPILKNFVFLGAWYLDNKRRPSREKSYKSLETYFLRINYKNWVMRTCFIICSFLAPQITTLSLRWFMTTLIFQFC